MAKTLYGGVEVTILYSKRVAGSDVAWLLIIETDKCAT